MDLDRIQVATPCTARWEDMKGDGRVRSCDECQLRVYNLSGMDRAAAERLVGEAEGRLCVRFYRRADGTVLTADCPVGLAALAAKARRAARRAASFVSALFGLGLLAGCPSEQPEKPDVVMGKMCIDHKGDDAPISSKDPTTAK
jgi:hypothetical protein